MTLDLSESELELLQCASERGRTPLQEYARYALVRMAMQDTRLCASRESEASAEPPPPPRRSLRRVIEGVAIPTHEIVKLLREFLGPQLLALTLSCEIDDIDQWVREESQPSEVHERRLREAHEAWQLVCTLESPDTTRAWWMGMKDALDDLSPAEAIARDMGRDVMAVARAYVESA